MAKIMFNVPDAWVADNEYVYGIVEEGITRADTADRMNKALKEWDYPTQINDHRECGVFWIDPTYLINEESNWKDGISYTRVGGWVEILTIDTEELSLPGILEEDQMNELCKDSRYIGGVFYCCDETGDHTVHVAECNPDITWED